MRCGVPGRLALAPLGDADAADLAAALIELAANTQWPHIRRLWDCW
jgi:hypothetical protein